MPPKKNLEDLVTALSEKMDSMSTNINERFDELDKHFKELKEDNAKLKEKVSHLEEENAQLKIRNHDLEIHSRASNVRIFNFSPTNEDYHFEELADQLYEEVFLPILQGAASKGRLKSIPSKDRLILAAHPLHAKEGKPRPVICRLLNNSYRTIILQCQKEFGMRIMRSPSSAASRPSPASQGPVRPSPLRHPIFEDCTSELYRYKQALAAHLWWRTSLQTCEL